MRSKVIFFISSALFVGAIGGWIWGSGILSKKDLPDIAVEFHGMIFDVILFGIILTVYEVITEKRRLIRNYKDQLESYRDWYGEEAAFRVRFVISELDKLGVKNLDFSRLHLGKVKREIIESLVETGVKLYWLEDAILDDANLQKANLSEANLKGANLVAANLQGANLSSANLEGAAIDDANLQEVDLTGAILDGAFLSDSNLQGAKMQNCSMQGTRFVNSNLQEAILFIARLQGARLKYADLKGAKALIEQKEDFAKVMTKEQLDSIIWHDNQTLQPLEDDEVKDFGQCQAKKRNGEQCTRKAKKGFEKCTQHLKMEVERF